MANVNNSTDNVFEFNFNELIEVILITWMWKICGAFLIFPGLVGNFVAMCVFSKLKITSSSINVHCFVLAIADSTILVTVLLRHWIIFTFDFDVRDVSDVGCKIHNFLSYTFSDFSPWILVSLSCERVMTVYRPFDFRRWCTVKRAICRLAAIFVALCVINVHLLWTYELILDENGNMGCDNIKQTQEMRYYDNYVFVWIDLLMVSFIPSVIMIVCSALIIRKLGRSDFAYNPKTRAVSTRDSDAQNQQPKVDRNTSETRLLLVLAIVYVCLSLPHSSTYIISALLPEDCFMCLIKADAAWAATYLILACNYSINIILYTARSKTFRLELRKLFRRTSPRLVKTLVYVFSLRQHCHICPAFFVCLSVSLSVSLSHSFCSDRVPVAHSRAHNHIIQTYKYIYIYSRRRTRWTWVVATQSFTRYAIVRQRSAYMALNTLQQDWLL